MNELNHSSNMASKIESLLFIIGYGLLIAALVMILLFLIKFAYAVVEDPFGYCYMDIFPYTVYCEQQRNDDANKDVKELYDQLLNRTKEWNDKFG